VVGRALILVVLLALGACTSRSGELDGIQASPAPAPSASAAQATAISCVGALPEELRIGQTMLVTTTDLARVHGWLKNGLIAGILASGTLDRATAAELEMPPRTSPTGPSSLPTRKVAGCNVTGE
jgi:hypothetical protein